MNKIRTYGFSNALYANPVVCNFYLQVLEDCLVKKAIYFSFNTFIKAYLAICLLLGSFVFAIFLIVFYAYISVPFNDIRTLAKGYVQTTIVGKLPHYKVTSKRSNNWSSLNEVSRYGIKAITLSEDWAFYQHKGFDVEQIKVAILENLTEGKTLRGASTITQQLAKNLFLSHERSIWRKFKELFITLELERNLKKDKILETYLNIVEFGEGLYGIKNASRYYFKKSPANLTPREAAFLAMLLPGPKKYAISFHRKSLTKFARSSLHKILKKMQATHVISSEQFYQELSRPFFWEKGVIVAPKETDEEVNEESEERANDQAPTSSVKEASNDEYSDDSFQQKIQEEEVNQEQDSSQINKSDKEESLDKESL